MECLGRGRTHLRGGDGNAHLIATVTDKLRRGVLAFFLEPVRSIRSDAGIAFGCSARSLSTSRACMHAPCKGGHSKGMHVLNRWAHLLLRRAAAAAWLSIMPNDAATCGFHHCQSECFNLALSHAHGAGSAPRTHFASTVPVMSMLVPSAACAQVHTCTPTNVHLVPMSPRQRLRLVSQPFTWQTWV